MLIFSGCGGSGGSDTDDHKKKNDPPTDNGGRIEDPPINDGDTTEDPPIDDGDTVEDPPIDDGDTVEDPPVIETIIVEDTNPQALKNMDIVESSGLAFSTRDPEILWTHNDHGNSAILYAFDLQGNDLGTISFLFTGVLSIDWEDMAAFEMDGNHYLIIGEVGDNNKRRNTVWLYILLEPEVLPQSQIFPEWEIEFTYPDGPQNCEGIAVDPVERYIYLINKTASTNCWIYRVPLDPPLDGQSIIAEKVTQPGISMATAMDIHRDQALILTPSSVQLYQKQPGKTWQETFGRMSKNLILNIPELVDPEGATFSPDGSQIFITSEKKLPTPLVKINLP